MSEIKPDGHITKDDNGYTQIWLNKKPKQTKYEGEKVWCNDEFGRVSIRYTGKLKISPSELLEVSLIPTEQINALVAAAISANIELGDISDCHEEECKCSTCKAYHETDKALKPFEEVKE